MLRAVLATVACLAMSALAQTKDWKQIELHYRNAQEALRLNQSDIAGREFREILRLDPTNAQARANLGVIAFTRKDFENAAREFTAALVLEPALWNAKAFLGMSELRLNHQQEARELLEDAFNRLQDPDLRNRTGSDLIALYYASGNLDKVVDVVRVLQRSKGTSPDVLYAAYRAYSDLAAKSLATLAQVAPESAQMHQILAQNLANQDDFQGAIAQYRRALELDPYLPGLHAELGQMILSSSNTEPVRAEAEKEFQKDLASNPTNAFSEYMLGEVEWLRVKPSLALEHYMRALELRPDFANAQIAAGKALTHLNRLNEAVKHLEEALRLDPQSEVAHYRLSQALEKLGRGDEAQHEMAKFKELSDSHQSTRALYQQVLQRSAMQTIDP
jgi:tetratricopeptide (TPR) repeat protein